MNISTRLAAGVALGALMIAAPIASKVFAADVFERAASMKDGFPEPRAIDWTGFFVGGAVGYTMANTEASYGGFATLDGIGSEGFNGCGIIGARKDFGLIVAGVEGRGCVSNIETDLSLGGTSVAGYESDYSYAGYGSVGVQTFGGLLSGIVGYKVAHVEGSGILSGYEEDFGGVSFGAVYETKLTNRLNLGLEAIYDMYEEQTYGPITVDPSALNVGLRLTTQF
jgi:outer membrane immunogenic protein